MTPTAIITAEELTELWQSQIDSWELARNNFQSLSEALKRSIDTCGVCVGVQYNPGRLTSVSSKPQIQQPNRCFLCRENRPREQAEIRYANEYAILVNPYPIFDRHFTIASTTHTPQCIDGRMTHLLDLARSCAPYTFFYNGAKCGASAPMHMHFQAGIPGYLPIERQWRDATKYEIASLPHAGLYRIDGLLRAIFLLIADSKNDALLLWEKLYHALPSVPEEEPMMNIIVRHEEMQWVVLIFPRHKHRPDCYYATGEAQYLISPGAVEMGGVFITPRYDDYERLSAEKVCEIYTEVSLSPAETASICKKI